MKTEWNKSPYLWVAALMFFVIAFLNIDMIGTEKTVVYSTGYVLKGIAFLAFYGWLFWRAGKDSK